MEAEKTREPQNLPYSDNIQRVLILGHTGFIGSSLMRYFTDHSTEVEVVGRALPTVDLIKERDVATLAELFDLNTAVIMCAAIKKQLGDSLKIFSQNLQMVVNLCHLLQDRPVRRFVYFSSAAVYGEDIHNTNITEETPVHPTSYYGIGKYTGERLLHKTTASQADSSLLVLRSPLVYGLGDRSKGYGPSGFAWAAANGREVTLWGNGSEHREFIFVEDLAKIVCRLTLHEYEGVVNVASGKSHTFKDALEIVSKLAPSELQLGSRLRTKEKVDHGFNNKLLVKLVPDISFTTLEEGIKRTFDAEYRARPYGKRR